MKKSILKIYATILGIGLPYYAWVSLTGRYIPCFYLSTTGFKCPGCGISHMFVAMAKLDFAKAFSYNPVMFVLFFVWNAIALLCFIGKPAFVQSPKFLYGALYVTVVVLFAFWLLRNLC